MSENSLAPFDDVSQNMRELYLPSELIAAAESDTKCVVPIKEYIQALEMVVCGRISTGKFTRSQSKYIKETAKTIKPAGLTSRRQSGQHALARYVIYYILDTHERYSPYISSPMIGKLYCRDHTTLLYGRQKLQDRINDYPKGVEARLVQSVLTRMKMLGWD